MALDLKRIEALASEYADRHPRDLVGLAVGEYGTDLSISFSGAEDVVLIDMAVKAGGEFRVFALDTGRLHPETYQFLDRVSEHYDISLDVMFPQPEAVQDLITEKGLFSFYRDGHRECCSIRKVEPLVRALSGRAAWLTGQRRDQSPGTRAAIPVVQLDRTFGSPETPLVKFNPLANWTSSQVWAYIREYDVPFNPLHQRGFISIGCEPCTRPVHPGQHERAGRWWWEEETIKECGLHASNLNE
ncbi:MAG: phosphoadenylyl-sulfate reductase [Proteobacteria bacterium]|nr:phosphoadenylyl-sulfate reductase [Pseudomonadota bacterium]